MKTAAPIAPSINVFLDTNVYLSFYRYTSDDLEALRQFAVLAKGRRAALWLPEQLEDEFWRNRDSVIHSAVRGLEKASLSRGFPRLCSGYAELKELHQSAAKFARAQDAIVKRIRDDAKKHKLPADEVVTELFEATSSLETDAVILERASDRSSADHPANSVQLETRSTGSASLSTCLMVRISAS